MNKRVYLLLGVMFVVALLAGGTFIAIQLLNASQNNASEGDKSVKVDFIPAPELPKQAADLSGLVISVKDNSVFVAQVSLNQVSVRRILQQPTLTGPYTEVVVTKDTKIYQDVTYDEVSTPSDGSTGGAMQQVQQKLNLIDSSAISSPSYVQVWGQRRGDRINADIIAMLVPTFDNSAGGQ